MIGTLTDSALWGFATVLITLGAMAGTVLLIPRLRPAFYHGLRAGFNDRSPNEKRSLLVTRLVALALTVVGILLSAFGPAPVVGIIIILIGAGLQVARGYRQGQKKRFQ